MDTKSQYAQGHGRTPEVDQSDVSVRGIAGFLIGLTICVTLTCLVLAGMFVALRKAFTSSPANANALVGTREPLPSSAQSARTLFPEPRLQSDYFGDLAKERKEWNDQLNSYGWLDKNAGIVHIPIDRAMQLTLQRGLPVRVPGQQPPTVAPVSKPSPEASQ